MGTKHAERQITVSGTPQECFAALIDYESFPEWQRAVRSVDVLSRDSESRGEEVAFRIDAKLRSIAYTLAYSYEAPHLISWRFVEGDPKDVEGDFTLEDNGDDTTLVTYSLVLDLGSWMPGRLARLVGEQIMQGALDDLKQHIEK
jgi:uncharacterized membrane protein